VGIQTSLDCKVSHNQIVSNTRTGVVVWDNTAFRDKISENVIHGNGALGIDLGGDGVTPNDGNNNNPAKPNRGYNYPVISTPYLDGGNVTVSGTAPPQQHCRALLHRCRPRPHRPRAGSSLPGYHKR